MLRSLVSVGRGGKVHLWRRNTLLFLPSKNLKITSIFARSLWIAPVVYEVKEKNVHDDKGTKCLSDLKEEARAKEKVLLNRKHIYFPISCHPFWTRWLSRTTFLPLGKVFLINNFTKNKQFCSCWIQDCSPSLRPALGQGHFYFFRLKSEAKDFAL